MHNGESSSSNPQSTLKKKKLEESAKATYETLKVMKAARLSVPETILAPFGKLLKLTKLKDDYDELQDKGHSPFASFMGAGAGIAAKSTAAVGGATLVIGAVAAANVPPVAATVATAGLTLMYKSNEAGKIAKHKVPILVDTTIEQLSHVYASATQFVSQAFQKWSHQPEYSSKKFSDIESVMLELGYQAHVEPIYAQLNQEQKLLYSTITRDLFNEQFKLYTDHSVKAEPSFVHPTKSHNVDVGLLKGELSQVQDQLAKEAERFENGKPSQIDLIIKEQNKQLSQHLSPLVNQANQTSSQKSNLPPQVKKSESLLQDAYEFCEVMNATSQGLALVARISGNSRVANKILQSSMAATHIISGVASIAANGLSAGPVGMVFGGMNMLVACFGEEDSGMEALAEQLAVISSQIHALHEDMLDQFAKVFTALGIINTNIIEGFKLLHESQDIIFKEIGRLQKSLSLLQDSVNVIGHNVHDLRSELRGYVVEDDRKQLQLHLNNLREAIKRPYQRAKLQPKLIAAFKTYNEELIARQMAGPLPTNTEITRSLTTQLGSAEANIGLLLNYAKNELDLDVRQPIADPEQWRQATEILIQMVNKDKDGHALIGEQDFEDFKYLRAIGDHWLDLIHQFKRSQSNPISTLFMKYRRSVNELISVLNQEMQSFEDTQRKSRPKHQGIEELKKQEAFKFEFNRNSYYTSVINDLSYCKGFNNWFSRDDNVGLWYSHISQRQAEIKAKLEDYKKEIENAKKDYENITITLFDSIDAEYNTSASSFMVHELSPNMPFLPLPLNVRVPALFLEAEKLELGHISHQYRFEANNFIYTMRFHWQDPALQPTLMVQFRAPGNVPNYLNPAEAVWHAYMGGSFPSSSGTTRTLMSHYTPNGDYHAYTYCNMPTIASFDGLRKKLVLVDEMKREQASDENLVVVRTKVNKVLKTWRSLCNKKIAQQLESVDLKNPLAKALSEVDASAKLLIAFISILFRENYERPSAIWSYSEISDFVQGYRGQNIYLTHQLEENIRHLELIEQELLENFNAQTQSAYTPVRDALLELDRFMSIYESRVISDADLAKQARMEQNREVALLGAARAALLIQSNLAKNGHLEAADYITELFSQLNLGGILALPLDSASASIPPISQEKGLYFSRGFTPSHVASNESSSSKLATIEEIDEEDKASKEKGKEKAPVSP